jgi:uncharacterized protein (TIGR02444 family)
MIVAPCSVRTMSEIATGVTASLLTRAADVTLKERRPLVLMVRETPLHLGHLRTLTKLAEMGAVIAPPLPAFYAKPRRSPRWSTSRWAARWTCSASPGGRSSAGARTCRPLGRRPGRVKVNLMRLWDWALEVYARPSVAAACLRCRTDTARTCPICCGPPGGPAKGRAADAQGSRQDGQALGRRGRLAPARRPPHAQARLAGSTTPPRGLAQRGQGVELHGEKVLMESLEALSGEPGPPLDDSDTCSRPPRRPATRRARPRCAPFPTPLKCRRLERLYRCQALLSITALGPSRRASMNDDDASEDSDIAIERRLATLREDHQDLGDAVQALEDRPSPTCCRSPASSAASWP